MTSGMICLSPKDNPPLGGQRFLRFSKDRSVSAVKPQATRRWPCQPGRTCSKLVSVSWISSSSQQSDFDLCLFFFEEWHPNWPVTYLNHVKNEGKPNGGCRYTVRDGLQMENKQQTCRSGNIEKRAFLNWHRHTTDEQQETPEGGVKCWLAAISGKISIIGSCCLSFWVPKTKISSLGSKRPTFLKGKEQIY